MTIQAWSRYMQYLREGWTMGVKGAAFGAALLMGGCAYSPSINVLGAYFPDWLFCVVVGVALAVIVYLILEHTQCSDCVGPAAVVYPALVTALSLVVWLLAFQH
ncbi:cation transporter-like permease [Paraburkholderia sp. MM6662-R1]